MVEESIVLKGASGQSYRFALAGPDARFNAVGAVYAFLAWPMRSGPFFVSYVGQTEDFLHGFRAHPVWPEAEAEWGAALVAGLVLPDAEARDRIERDLIRAYAPPLNMTGDILCAQGPSIGAHTTL